MARFVLLILSSVLSFNRRVPRPMMGTDSGVKTTRKGIVGNSGDRLAAPNDEGSVSAHTLGWLIAFDLMATIASFSLGTLMWVSLIPRLIREEP